MLNGSNAVAATELFVDAINRMQEWNGLCKQKHNQILHMKSGPRSSEEEVSLSLLGPKTRKNEGLTLRFGDIRESDARARRASSLYVLGDTLS